MKNHHYFASHGLGFATGATRDEAIENVIDGFRHDLKPWVRNHHKAGDPGVYIWSVKVMGSSEKNYKVAWFAPVGVRMYGGREHYVTYVTNKKHAVWNVPKAASIAMKKEAA